MQTRISHKVFDVEVLLNGFLESLERSSKIMMKVCLIFRMIEGKNAALLLSKKI